MKKKLKKLLYHELIEKQFRAFQSTKKQIGNSYWYCNNQYEINICGDGAYFVCIENMMYVSADLEELENYLFETFIIN